MKLGKFTKFSELTSNLGFFLPNELDFCQINEDIRGLTRRLMSPNPVYFISFD